MKFIEIGYRVYPISMNFTCIQLQDDKAQCENFEHLHFKLKAESKIEIQEEFFSSDSEPESNSNCKSMAEEDRLEFSNYTFSKEHQHFQKFLNRNGTILEPVKDEELSDDEC